MQSKIFEVRDRRTFIPVLAVRLDPTCEAERFLLARAGYGRTLEAQGEYIVVYDLVGGDGGATSDPFKQPNRTLTEAHRHILAHFAALETGAVIDVEFILGLSAAPKLPEAVS